MDTFDSIERDGSARTVKQGWEAHTGFIGRGNIEHVLFSCTQYLQTGFVGFPCRPGTLGGSTSFASGEMGAAKTHRLRLN